MFYTFSPKEFHCSLRKSHSGFHFASLISLGRHHFLYQQHSRPQRQQARISSWASVPLQSWQFNCCLKCGRTAFPRGEHFQGLSTTEHLPWVHLAPLHFKKLPSTGPRKSKHHKSPWNPPMLTQNSPFSSHSYTWGKGKKVSDNWPKNNQQGPASKARSYSYGEANTGSGTETQLFCSTSVLTQAKNPKCNRWHTTAPQGTKISS